MSTSDNGLGVQQGELRLFVSQPGQPHDIDFWVERAMERIMTVADTAPQPIRDQAIVFQNNVAQIIKATLKSAIDDHRAYGVLQGS